MNLTHNFLLSMPQMQDPNFRHTLTYLIEHGEHGALGFIINRTLDIDLHEVFDQMDIETDSGIAANGPVFEGGPVDQEHGLVLHPSGSTWDSSKDFGHGITLSSSRDILVAMANGTGPEDCLVVLGHSGWGPGQLESELANNAWLHCEADHHVMFNADIDGRLSAAADLLGIKLSNVVQDTGHA